MTMKWVSSIIVGDYLEIQEKHLIEGKKSRASKAGVDIKLEFGDNRWRGGRTIAQVTKIDNDQIWVKQVSFGGWEPLESAENIEVIPLEDIDEWAAKNRGRSPKEQQDPLRENRSLSQHELNEALSRVEERNQNSNQRVREKVRAREDERMKKEEEIRRQRLERLAEADDGTSGDDNSSDSSVKARSEVQNVLDNKNDLINGNL